MSPITAKILSVVLATGLVVVGGVVIADLVSADDPDHVSAIDIRKDDAGAEAELVDDDENEGDGDDARGDRDDTRSDKTRGGRDTLSDHTAAPATGPAPVPAPAPAPVYSDDGGYSGDDGGYSDG
jgi:hypothetical protein